MTASRKALLWITLLCIAAGPLAGCATPALNAPVNLPAPLAQSSVSLFAGQAANAAGTPTATPFQPLPPTPVYYPTEVPTATPTPPGADQTVIQPLPDQPSIPAGALPKPPDQINVLLLGSDQRPFSSGFRTDVIILASINPSSGTVNLVSFPRDLFITIPGWGQDRINTAWSHGGFNKLAETLEFNFGVRPDHYVLINFWSFKRVVDSLGGLEVNVGETVSDYYNGRWITIKQGRQAMNADLVLWYVRTRKTTSDFARHKRQQEVLMAIVDRMISLDAIRRAPEFYNIYKENVTTTLNLGDLLSLLPLGAQIAADTSRIHQYFIGPKLVSNWITPGGAMVLLPDRQAIIQLLRKVTSGQ